MNDNTPKKSLEQYIVEFQTGNDEIRANAIYVIGNFKDERVPPLLALALRDKYSEVRRNGSTIILRRNYDKQNLVDKEIDVYLEPLLQLGNDENLDVHRLAFAAISVTGDARVVEPLISYLKHHKPNVRYEAVQALSMMKALNFLTDNHVIEPLIALFDDEESYYFPYIEGRIIGEIPSKIVGEYAMQVLVLYFLEAAVEPLSKALSSEKLMTRARAATALGRIGDEQTIPTLVPLLNDDSMLVVTTVHEALAKLGYKFP